MDKKTISDLATVLTYENPRVLNKFRTLFSIDKRGATDIFTELKRWLWVCAIRRTEFGQPNVPQGLVIHQSMVVIDELWHVFILHTEDYVEFCEKHFGFYIHHSPGSPDFVQQDEPKTRLQLEYLCVKLGEEALIRWYEEYHERYSPDHLARLARQPQFGRPCEVL